jgi:hypothetical protein
VFRDLENKVEKDVLELESEKKNKVRKQIKFKEDILS